MNFNEAVIAITVVVFYRLFDNIVDILDDEGRPENHSTQSYV